VNFSLCSGADICERTDPQDPPLPRNLFAKSCVGPSGPCNHAAPQRGPPVAIELPIGLPLT
jgi:hypothetical protein